MNTSIGIRALRNVGIGMGRELKAGETGEVDAVDANFLVAIDAVALVNPADASRVAAAAEKHQADLVSQSVRDRVALPWGGTTLK